MINLLSPGIPLSLYKQTNFEKLKEYANHIEVIREEK